MTFYILQIEETSSMRTTSLAEFNSLKQARDNVWELVRSLSGNHGYENIGDFWWYQDNEGNLIRLYVDEEPTR